jgi:hypothetical protein
MDDLPSNGTLQNSALKLSERVRSTGYGIRSKKIRVMCQSCAACFAWEIVLKARNSGFLKDRGFAVCFQVVQAKVSGSPGAVSRLHYFVDGWGMYWSPL